MTAETDELVLEVVTERRGTVRMLHERTRLAGLSAAQIRAAMGRLRERRLVDGSPWFRGATMWAAVQCTERTPRFDAARSAHGDTVDATRDGSAAVCCRHCGREWAPERAAQGGRSGER